MNATISPETTPQPDVQTPIWFWTIASLGLTCNAYGLTKFIESITFTRDEMVATDMTAGQAELYATLPTSMHAVFAIGVLGALVGCLLLLARYRLAVPVFRVSFAGYLALYVGDIVQGFFTAFGASQTAILTTVVAIDAGLLLTAVRARNRRILR